MTFQDFKNFGKYAIIFINGEYILTSYNTPILIYHYGRDTFSVTKEFFDYICDNDYKISITTQKHIKAFKNYLENEKGFYLKNRVSKKSRETDAQFYLRMFKEQNEF